MNGDKLQGEPEASLDEQLADAIGVLRSDTGWYVEKTAELAEVAAEHRRRRAEILLGHPGPEWKATAAADADPHVAELAARTAQLGAEQKAALELVATGRCVIDGLRARVDLAVAAATAPPRRRAATTPRQPRGTATATATSRRSP
jgi:hypothetical protein